MTKSVDTQFCVEHRHRTGHDGKDNDKDNDKDKDKDKDVRVPCPLDPHHTVWAHKLAKHLKVCNKAKQSTANVTEPYFSKDLNRGDVSTKTDDGEGRSMLVASAKLLLDHISECVEREDSVKHNEFMDGNRLLELSNTIKKHARQQSSLIQNLVDEKLIPASTVMEFGCGRAEFSRYINQTILHSDPYKLQDELPSYVFVDRGSNRMKFDKKFQDDLMQLSKNPEKIKQRIGINRLKMDIKDLKLSTIVDEGDEFLVVSKHLCGVATDLTLRCLYNCLQDQDKVSLKGLCIAMCCRHVCNARDYINPDYVKSFLSSHNSELEYDKFFKNISKFTSWATCGRRPGMQDDDIIEISEPGSEDKLSLTILQREKVGMLARQIIDNGRLQWVKDNLLTDKHTSARIVKYIEQSVSLENNALILH